MHGGDGSGEAAELVYTLYQEARSRLSAGHPGSAVELLELAVEREPRKASLRETLGRAYFATARVARARSQFEQALTLDPSDDYAHFGVGRCYEREGRLPEAAKHYKLACALADRQGYHDALRRVRSRQPG
ncbi:MAG: tetratricopeptide repeat protein [Egibacteraceae bacterium]